MSSFLLFVCFLASTLPIFGIRVNKHDAFNHARPESGVGPIEISFDNLVDQVNETKLLFIFDKDCETTQTHQGVIKSILDTYESCLTNTSFHFDFPSLGMALTYLDINTEKCHLDRSLELNWDDLCIDSIMYESLHSQNSYMNIDAVQCEYENVTQGPDGYSWGLDDINAAATGFYEYPVRDYDNGVDIFIIDDGIRSTHDEFYPNQVQTLYGDGFTKSFGEYDAHGTHVAGLASGINYGSSKNFTIYNLQCCLYFICGEATLLNALQTVLDFLTTNSGRRGVINMSLGFARNFLAVLYTYYADAIEEVGGVLVVAAGNDNNDACYKTPAYASNVITVGAYEYDDTGLIRRRASFSNYGDCVDAWAPGRRIKSAYAECDSCYADWSGTSMASPLVTGVVANLLWINPNLTFNEIKSALTMFNMSETLSCGADYTDTCVAMQYYCDNLTDYTITGSPTSSTTQSPYIDLSVDNSYGCNYVKYVVYNEYDRSDILEETYIPTDICMQQQEYLTVARNTTTQYSFMYECSDSNNYTVTMNLYDSNANCSGTPDVTEQIVSGFDDNYHYYVINCANDKSEDTGQACNIKSTWYDAFVGNLSLVDAYEAYYGVDIDESTYYSTARGIYCPPRLPYKYATKAYLVGYCYKSLSTGKYYRYYCDDSGGLYELYYNNSNECNNNIDNVLGYVYYDVCANYTNDYPDDQFEFSGNYYVTIEQCTQLGEFDFTLSPSETPTTGPPTPQPTCMTDLPICNYHVNETFSWGPGNVTSTIEINTGMDDIYLSSMEVSVEGEHPWMWDVFLNLYAPDGTSLKLLKNRGGDSDGFKLIFNDNGIKIDNVDDWYNKTVAKPQGGAFKKRFRNTNPNGNWTLWVRDTYYWDDGELYSFCITELCYYSYPDPTSEPTLVPTVENDNNNNNNNNNDDKTVIGVVVALAIILFFIIGAFTYYKCCYAKNKDVGFDYQKFEEKELQPTTTNNI